MAPVEFEPYSLDLGSLLPEAEAERKVLVAVRRQDESSSLCEFGAIECSPPGAIHASWESEVDAPPQPWGT